MHLHLLFTIILLFCLSLLLEKYFLKLETGKGLPETIQSNPKWIAHKEISLNRQLKDIR